MQGDCNSTQVRQSLLAAAADLFLFSLADIHVVTARSGFGVIAALTKKSDKHEIYSIDGKRTDGNGLRHGPSCGGPSLYNASSHLATLAEEWTGF